MSKKEARSRLKQETRIENHTELTSPEACNQDPCDCPHCIGYTQEQFDAVVQPLKGRGGADNSPEKQNDLSDDTHPLRSLLLAPEISEEFKQQLRSQRKLVENILKEGNSF